VRHPNVLSFLHSTEVENLEGSVVKPTIYIVTEPVMPLAEKVKELNLDGTQRYIYVWELLKYCSSLRILYVGYKSCA
jgi:SCY1-like protein 1